ncbi:superfamily II DNA or RNA helicase [Methanococcus voltae PS]|uniref:Superfamily II DNA or RNA helicase n=1 Tax=Methanococcus voltae PS TaxID=523842 RepID=A0ABT2EX88_METVO|nr:DEAD/DEAH box helicase family protein [Methanococcus voltae]MCS3922563.1 superfamily II DNA or RNA helicase [Methanococcus voltae PS]
MKNYKQYKKTDKKQLVNHIGVLLTSIANFRSKIVLGIADGSIKELKKDLTKSAKNMNFFEVRYLVELDKQYQKPNNRNSWAYCEFMEIPDFNSSINIANTAETISNKIYEKEQQIKQRIGSKARITTVSIGIAPRQEKKGTSKSSTAWSYIPIDFDIDEWKDKEPSKEEMNQKIKDIFNTLPDDYTKPHLIVFTGGGLRFIYYIDRPISRLELPIFSKIAEDIGNGADSAMYDIARVDRLPGTKNRKEKYGTERNCKILFIKNSLVPITPEVFIFKFGVENKEYISTVKESSETTESFELINKLKKANIKIKDFKSLSKKEYKFTKFIQTKLTEKYNKDWIIELFNYLKIGYKSNGKYISIYSIYYNDGNNPDCTIYPNQAHNAVAVDWHNNSLRTNIVAYLWGGFKDKILEFIKLKGISNNLGDYVSAEEYLIELLNKNKEASTIKCNKYLSYDVLQTAVNKSIKTKESVILQAETGRGKTYNITNNIDKLTNDYKDKTIVLLFPYRTQVKQTQSNLLNKGIRVPAYYEGSKAKHRTANDTRLIIGTYNQLFNIMDDIKFESIKFEKTSKGTYERVQIRDDDDVILIVDESHNMILQKDLRRDEINKIENYSEKVHASVYLTATPELVNLQNRKIVKAEFNDNKKYFKNTYVVESDIGHLANYNVINFCKYITTAFNRDCKKSLVLVDSKKEIEVIKELLNIYNFNSPIYEITRESVETDEAAQMIIKQERIPDGLILATRVIAEGINIKNGSEKEESVQMNIKDKVDIVAVLKTSSATIMRQFLARVRNGGNTCIIYSQAGHQHNILKYNKMLEIAKEDLSLFNEYLMTEYNGELMNKDMEFKYTNMINQLQVLKWKDGEYIVDESKIASLVNRKLERQIVADSSLLKTYFEATTNSEWKIIPHLDIEGTDVSDIIETRKFVKELNEFEVLKVVEIINDNFEAVDTASLHHKYDMFTETEKYLVMKHIKICKRVISYLKLHNEYPELSKLLMGKDASTEEIAEAVSSCAPAKWGSINKRINIAYNIVKGLKNNIKDVKGYKRIFESKVLIKIFKLGNKLNNKKINIKSIINIVKRDLGIKLKFEEIKNILSSIYTYNSSELKTKRENATIQVFGIDNLLNSFVKIFNGNIKIDLDKAIINKAKGGISTTELLEYVTEVLKYPIDTYEQVIKKLKIVGDLFEPRKGFFISE